MNYILSQAREWQQIKQAQATEAIGTPAGVAYLVDAERYGMLADEIERLTKKIAKMTEYLNHGSSCPCCGESDVCAEGCSFHEDCPEAHKVMQEARGALE